MDILSSFRKRALARFWVFSDLQQRDPRIARHCIYTALDDVLSLGLELDGACYLGDSTEGASLPHLEEMAAMQVEALAKIDVPIYYVMGNHELDYHRQNGSGTNLLIPMREAIRNNPQWHTTATPRDWCFSGKVGELTLFFLSDRAGTDGGDWIATHLSSYGVHGAESVNYDAKAHAVKVREEMGKIEGPFFSFSHYAYPGGNRSLEGPLQSYLMPLPGNMAAHLYGHSHIGDYTWGGKDGMRQISSIDGTAITQIDVSSLDNQRGTATRSAILEWYGGHDYGVFFRCHDEKRWEKAFLSDNFG